jgi:hypothetical protein
MPLIAFQPLAIDYFRRWLSLMPLSSCRCFFDYASPFRQAFFAIS